MVISLVYIPPFLAVECVRETDDRLVCHHLIRLAKNLVVAQFCRAKDYEIINESAECVWSENVMQFLYHHQLPLQVCRHITNLLVGVSLVRR